MYRAQRRTVINSSYTIKSATPVEKRTQQLALFGHVATTRATIEVHHVFFWGSSFRLPYQKPFLGANLHEVSVDYREGFWGSKGVKACPKTGLRRKTKLLCYRIKKRMAWVYHENQTVQK